MVALLMACAPAGSLRPPPSPAPGNTVELGSGVVAQVPRSWVDEPWRAAVQMWGGGHISDRVELATIVMLDDLGIASGIALRWLPVETDRLTAGLELQVGWLWIAVAVPVSARLFGQTRLYTAPRIGTFGAEWTPALPLGVSLGFPRNVDLRLEGQVSWPGFHASGRRAHLSAAAAHQW